MSYYVVTPLDELKYFSTERESLGYAVECGFCSLALKPDSVGEEWAVYYTGERIATVTTAEGRLHVYPS